MYRATINAALMGALAWAARAHAAGSSANGNGAVMPSTASVVAAVLAADDGAAAVISGSSAKSPGATAVTSAAAASAALPALLGSAFEPAAKRAFGDGTPESHVTTYGGYYRASDGYADRYIGGAFMDWQLGATGLHADLLYVDREQNAAYGALGVSQLIEGLGRVKVMAGTSSGNQTIVPKLFLSAGLDLRPGSQLIVRPSVAYRRFRGGNSQINPSVQVARYFGGSSNGFFVAQADGALYINDGGRTGWSLGGGITQVRTSGWRFGAALHRGYMTYDAITGTNVRSITYGGGPNVGFRFVGGSEIFFRSDVTRLS